MIEQTLERIAKALEDLVDVNRASMMAVEKPAGPAKVTPGVRKKGGGRVTKKSEGAKTTKADHDEDSAKADAANAAGIVEPWCTIDQLREHIRQYAAAFGGAKATEKIIKYGARKEKPLIAEVDPTRYKELVDDLQAEMPKK